jgi:hypothetical protein
MTSARAVRTLGLATLALSLAACGGARFSGGEPGIRQVGGTTLIEDVEGATLVIDENGCQAVMSEGASTVETVRDADGAPVCVDIDG